MKTQHSLIPNSKIDPQIHSKIIDRLGESEIIDYTTSAEYFFELVMESEDEADEINYKQEMHPIIYNCDTFEFLVGANFHVLKQVPVSMITNQMIDSVISNHPMSFWFLLECGVDVTEDMCHSIIDQMYDLDSAVLNKMIDMYPSLEAHMQTSINNQIIKNNDSDTEGDDVSDDDDDEEKINSSIEFCNQQISQMYTRQRTPKQSDAFQHNVDLFLQSHAIEKVFMEECSICSNPFSCFVKLDCSHEFCKECISSCIRSRDNDTRLCKNCPLCRTNIHILE